MQHHSLSGKLYLELDPFTEEAPSSEQKAIALKLEEETGRKIHFPLAVYRKMYPMIRDAGYHCTVSYVYRDLDVYVTDIEPADTTGSHYGLAVDYGSTTIIARLIDLNSGISLCQVREPNGQIRFGTDILTRITYTMEQPKEHREEIRRATLLTFERIFDRLQEETGIDVRRCPAMVISGNTTMIHFLLKLDAWTVFAAPYSPVVMNPGFILGQEIGFSFPGVVYLMPSISNYVGGDITSGLSTLDFYEKDGLSLFFDIGTNGELVVGNKDYLVAGAGAAGPALEGYISKYGLCACDGAIERVKINGADISWTTIGGTKPIGICGSGIIDLMAEMRLNGWINIAGDLNPEASPHVRYLEEEDSLVAVYAEADESRDQKPLYFSQEDIIQYISTKAAAHTMVDCLLEMIGCTEQDLTKLYLTGAFGLHADLESAITVGIFPDLPRDRFQSIPNASLDGAELLLKERDTLDRIDWLLNHVYSLQFASMPNFLVRMQEAKFIPHTDMRKYPNIAKRLGETVD